MERTAQPFNAVTVQLNKSWYSGRFDHYTRRSVNKPQRRRCSNFYAAKIIQYVQKLQNVERGSPVDINTGFQGMEESFNGVVGIVSVGS